MQLRSVGPTLACLKTAWSVGGGNSLGKLVILVSSVDIPCKGR